MNRISLFLAGAFATGVSTAACADPIIINVAYSSGAYTDVMTESARQFEAAHPDIKIKYVAPVANTYDELLQSTLRSSMVGTLPDVSLEGSQNVGTVVQAGIAMALDDLIASDKNWSDLGYSPSVGEVGAIGGKTYALAYATSVPTIYFNLDLLKKAGIDINKPPSDWQGLTEAAAKVNKLGGNTVGGLFDYNSTGNWTFQAIITSLGGKILTDDRSDVAFNSPEGLKALQILHDFGTAGTVDMSQAQMLQAFASGTVGVFASYSAALGQIEKQVAGKFAVKAAPWPIPTKDGRVPAGGRVLMIYAKDAEKQKAAWEYAKFLTGPVGQTILVKSVGAVPVNSKAISDPALLGQFYQDNPNQKPALEATARLTNWLSYPGKNSIKISEAIRDHLRRVLIAHEKPKVVMADMMAAIKPLLQAK
ncbi:ABC transporter substrate-binding protein [Rhizobium giardinii]|uniref:Multiple sugar transport system substrate-binding protein n=1 Tax=Rhizobium giardinii TaxID=56731 RepID=A0A7W8UG58_9HYPH|nr:ABC transporter substrate-binding protein [Rhizobium giardinii]MBB5538786.1 multiple sugar transport system substrate-binding protein [Rhizobium giardinii]